MLQDHLQVHRLYHIGKHHGIVCRKSKDVVGAALSGYVMKAAVHIVFRTAEAGNPHACTKVNDGLIHRLCRSSHTA